MAITSGGVWEIWPDGNENNGNVFSSSFGGTDRTQQATAQLTITDGASVGPGTTLTSVTGGFTADMVGNGIGIIESATYRGVWQITAFTNTNTVTVDRTLPATTGMTCRVGGAGKLAANGFIFIGQLVAGNHIYIKGPGASSGDYLVTTNSPTLSVAGSNVNPITTEGYTTTRGDGGRPTIRWSNSAINCLTVSGQFNIVKNLTLDASTGGLFALLASGGMGYYENVVCKNQAPCRVNSAGNFFKRCRFTDSNNADPGLENQSTNNRYVNCVMDSNSGHGIDIDDIGHFDSCLIFGNTLDGISYSDAGDDFGFTVLNCNIWNNSRDGIRISSTAADGILTGIVVQRCIFGKHASGYDINYTTSDISANTGAIQWAAAHLDCNAFYTTGTGRYHNLPTNSGDTILSASPFASDTDFTLTGTGGSEVRAAACAVTFSDGVNSGSYGLGALGNVAAADLATMISLWRERTGEKTERVVTDSIVCGYLQDGLEELNRIAQYHLETDSSSVVLAAGTQEYVLPGSFLEVRWVQHNGKELEKGDIEQWRSGGEDWRNEPVGFPRFWATYGDRIVFRPAPSAAAVAAAASPVIRAVTVPPDIETNGPDQLPTQSHRLAVWYGVASWSASYPDSALASMRYDKYMAMFQAGAEAFAAEFARRNISR